MSLSNTNPFLHSIIIKWMEFTHIFYMKFKHNQQGKEYGISHFVCYTMNSISGYTYFYPIIPDTRGKMSTVHLIYLFINN